MANVSYLRTEDAPILPPPVSDTGISGWLRRHVLSTMNDFSSLGAGTRSVLMAVLTLLLLYYGLSALWGIIDFAFVKAVWSDPEGLKRGVCTTTAQGGVATGEVGACWPYVEAKLKLFIYGRYPESELWRPNLVFALLAAGLGWIIVDKAPARRFMGLVMLSVFPLVALILLTGAHVDLSRTGMIAMAVTGVVLMLAGHLGLRGGLGEILLAFGGGVRLIGALFLIIAIVMFVMSLDYGLEKVPTDFWGGLLVTLVVALTGIVASLPLGIVLALGRRSSLPLFRILSITFIEFWRGVPLISVLFMSSVMLPLFLPEGTDFDKLLRALIGVALFSSAYMAENIRGGLQAIPSGQYEGAAALGLSYNQSMRMIILPQALKIVIPGIVNTFISLFKDTTLVLIIGLFDLLGMVQSTFTDPSWATPVTSATGYLVCAVTFWVFCFSMSRYSVHLERKLHTGHQR
ncbi:MAG TPA: amino acid ABC transporter permease [Thiolinea sp.]|nr:amino acid ABC transporter permease [Thiolinea sp.]